MYTIHQLANLAGITRRTLHYYDEIGLLSPSRIGHNGYRYYAEDALLRLQQILFYRALDISLGEIKNIVNQPGFDVMSALVSHRCELNKRIARLERLIATVDHTLMHLKGEYKMSQKEYFAAFSEEQQAEYDKEAMQMYDPEIVSAAVKRWNAYTDDQKRSILEEGGEIYQDFVDSIPKGAGSPEAQACVVRWRTHMAYFWTPDAEQMLGIVDGYNNDPRFKANFDKIDPRLAEFIREAVQLHVKN
jgi:DNA-binding transcriptional MerR regulator